MNRELAFPAGYASRSRCYRQWWCCHRLTVLFVGCLLIVQPAWSRPPEVRHRPWAAWFWCNPRTALSSYIYAQADLMRAQGERAVDFAEARVLLAVATDKDLDNWLEYMQRYWQRKIEYEHNRIKLHQVRQISKGRELNDRRDMKSRVWERIKNNPELTGPSIENGNALNFLLDRLATTLGAHDVGRLEGDVAFEEFEKLRLSREQLHALQLYQDGVMGGKVTFRADGSSNIDIGWWPPALRREEFQPERNAYAAARRRVIEDIEAARPVTQDKLDAMKGAYRELSESFYRSFLTQENETGELGEFRQHQAARNFIHLLGEEVLRLDNTGDGRAMRIVRDFHLEKETRDILELLAFMNRRGVRFAAAQPGDEASYYAVFAMMRDIYVTIAEDDEALKPVDLPR